MTNLISTSTQIFAAIRGVGVGVLQHANDIEIAHANSLGVRKNEQKPCL